MVRHFLHCEQLCWMKITLCAVVLTQLQDKVLVMLVSNYILWPIANALNAHLVPE